MLFTLAEWKELVPTIPFLTRAMIDFAVVMFIIWIYRTRGEVPPEAVIDRTMPADIAAELAAVPWYKSFGFWSTILVLAVIALYVRFF